MWDASALLVVLNSEPGADPLASELGEAVISAVNLSEVIAKLADAGVPEAALREALAGLPLEVVPFDEGSAYVAGLLRPATRKHGLSMGDRACLALARALRLPAVTADRSWAALDHGVELRIVR